MIFIDTNVFMYAVGGEHHLREEARDFFIRANLEKTKLCTSAEVLQELVHIYLATHRMDTLDTALQLARTSTSKVWPLEEEDISLARRLHDRHPELQARDLCHLATCQRHGIQGMKTFDQKLQAASANTKML